MCRLLNSLKEMASQPAASPAAKQLLAEAEDDYKARLKKVEQTINNYLDKMFAEPPASEEDLQTRINSARLTVSAYLLGVQASGAFEDMECWLVGAHARDKQNKLIASLKIDYPELR
jgi:hypothetical protein